MSSKLELDVCYHVYNWRHLVKAIEVTAGQLKVMTAYHWVDGLVTCGLTACTLGSSLGPVLVNEYGITLPLPLADKTRLSSIVYRQ